MHQRTVVLFGLIFVLLLAGCSVVNGSGDVVTDERDIDAFDSVQLGIDGDVTIKQGESTFLTIRGEDNIIERVETFVRGDTLIIRNRNRGVMTILRNTEPIEITISTPTLKEIDVSGSGNVYAEELTADEMDIHISGSGDVELALLESETVDLAISGSGNIDLDSLAAGNLDVSISGSGDVTLKGRADQADLSVSGSGTIASGNVAVNKADANISGSGEITTWVKESLEVHISGSGDISYYGNPQLKQSTSGSGDVTSLGAKE